MMNDNLKIAQKNIDSHRVQLKKAKENILILRASCGWLPESIKTMMEQIL